jgi:threonyl-tRNA synthetase
VKLKDALGREWQCPTIQVDLNLPKRFGVYYTGPDGQEHEVIMLHRALYGSLERFVGIFIEHTGGEFPVWVAPTQAMIVPVHAKAFDYANATLAVAQGRRHPRRGRRARREAGRQDPRRRAAEDPVHARRGPARRRGRHRERAPEGRGRPRAMPLAAFLDRIGREIREKTR